MYLDPRKETVPDKINFPAEEEKILNYWKKIKAFETSTRLSFGRPEFSFYDGPPFATGLPHYGHILAGTIKDVVTRYAYGTGHNVVRRFGWDCHGLPIEHEIDKQYNISGPADIMRIGITEYNNRCRSIVSRYADEWETVVGRFGRWIDFKNDYKTMYPSFMETVWWVFKQLFNKGLVYRGVRVMPFSTALSTPLSNFETSQNYKDVVDPSIVIRFPWANDPKTSFLAWTTTPWTLPANLALVVHPDRYYARILDSKTNEHYIIMESRIKMIYPSGNGYNIVDKVLGNTFVGVNYLPPFDYYRHLSHSKSFTVLADTYVTDEAGTGIVHSAPSFGEDDLRVCKENGIVVDISQLPCHIDECGRFISPASDFLGLSFTEANPKIIKHLKQRGLILLHSQHKHSYPFCWRSDTPIMYRAVPSWFVKVEDLVPKLLKNSQKSRWVPEGIRDNRFHNWLSNARDWNVSRNRYWGTPIPIWMSDDGQEIVCVGSIDELSELSGVRVEDLHREHVDHITIPSRQGRGLLHRTFEVFDCWFESGSMPYAQLHYPFENKERFEKTFPADFISEGIDQTRGWFYTLLVLSTALFDKPPFKNLVVSGLVLASDGQKMSKRKRNYPDPLEVVNKYGADCIRCYLTGSPAVKGEGVSFQERGLSELTRDFLIPWFNVYRFFRQYAAVYEKQSNSPFIFDSDLFSQDNLLIDQWLLSHVQTLIFNYRTEMDNYHLYSVFTLLRNFVEILTKWYIRMNRIVLRGDWGEESQFKSLNILFHSLFEFTHVASALCPFLSEYYFQNLKYFLPESLDENFESVHYRLLPIPKDKYRLPHLEQTFSEFCSVVELGRIIRERNKLASKHPLSELFIVHSDENFLSRVKKLEAFLLEDLNVKKVTYSTNHADMGLKLTLLPNYPLLGKRFRGNLKSIVDRLNEFSQEKLHTCLKEGKIHLDEEVITTDEVRISFQIESISSPGQYDIEASRELAVLLDIKPSSELEAEGLAREFINRIQRLRKKANISPTDEVIINYSLINSNTSESDNFLSAIRNNTLLIEKIIKMPVILKTSTENGTGDADIVQEIFNFAGSDVNISIHHSHNKN